jgi:predicted ATPase/class 3 adenylate cyclase
MGDTEATFRGQILPTGTVTFLFTDIEGSTKLAQGYPAEWETLRGRHHTILQSAMDAHNGYVFQVIGDAFCVAFHTASDGLCAAIEAQRQLVRENWGETPIKVRMGLHTGSAELHEHDYRGYLTMAKVQRITSVAYGGQVLLSNASAELLHGELPKGITLRDMKEHQLKGLPGPERLWQMLAPDLQHDFPPLQSLKDIPNNLPVQLTSFIGRENEIMEIKQAIHEHRLVTLTGSGGTGKTRLSLQVADKVLKQFPDGVWFVELAPLSDPALVPNTIASVLGVREEQGRPLMATLLDWLSNKEILFVLDNCEHLVKACAEFAAAGLQTSRGTRILASSRETLGITGETAFRVPSLEVPNPKDPISMDAITQYAAVRLFIERAMQALGTFRLTNANAPVVAQICYRLDGIPLAIELAAVRVRVMRVEQIAERLDNRFRLLTGGSRAALPRQQTLRALIDWSYGLLSEREQVLLRRLSAFAGTWTLEAAETVCADESIESSGVLDLLTHLVDKSLVGMDELAIEPRYRMLETIREYAREKLLEANERDQLHDHHLQFFVQFAERAQRSLETAQRTVWLPRMENEHDNLRAALEWACARDLETARWLAGILERFWFFGDHLSEAHTWYARVLDSGDRPTVTKGLALALLGSGIASLNLEYLDEAQVSFEQSVVFWQKLGVQKWLATSLAWLAYFLIQRGEHAQAHDLFTKHELLFRASAGSVMLGWVLSNWGSVKATIRRYDSRAKALLDEALSLGQSLQDPLILLLAYSSLGDWAILQDDYATARRYFLEALEWRRQLGTRWIIAAGLRQVANLMCLQGDYQQAEPLYTEALVMARALGDQRNEANVALSLGEVAIHLGEVERATTLLTESLASFRKWGDSLGIARCVMMFADLWQAQSENIQAARLLGFVEAWLESNQLQFVFFDHTNFARGVAAARAQLDKATFTAAWEKGRAMTIEQTIELALEKTNE